MIKNRFGISAFTLKIIALLAMLSSHIPIILPEMVPQKLLAPMYLFGRMAFPIFAFFLAYGWAHTKNKLRYALRIFIMAIFSQIPFSVGLRGEAWSGISSIGAFTSLNIGFSFLLAMLSLLVYDMLRKVKLSKFLCVIIAVLPAVAFEFLTPFHVDYGYIGVLLVLVMYATQSDATSFTFLSGGILAYMGGTIRFPMFSFNFYMAIPYAFTLLLLNLYNGKRGIRAKYLFYIFYPLHIVVLMLIKKYFA